MMENILPCRHDVAWNVSFAGLHPPAVFKQVRADNFNLEQGRGCSGCNIAPCFARDGERVNAIGDHCHAKRKVRRGEFVSKDTPGRVNVLGRVDFLKRLFDCVDSQIGRKDEERMTAVAAKHA